MTPSSFEICYYEIFRQGNNKSTKITSLQLTLTDSVDNNNKIELDSLGFSEDERYICQTYTMFDGEYVN